MSLGDQPSEDLPAIAARALERGLDSPTLRELAGLSRKDVREAHDLFLIAIAEVGLEMPPPSEAARELARQWAFEMLAGTLTPYEGSRLIWHNSWDTLDRQQEGQADDLVPFIGLASEWEDDPEHRAEYEQDMLAEARALLARA